MLLFRGLLSPPASVGTAAGTGAVVGAGDSIFPSVGTAAGTSTVAGVGAADLPSVGTASGTSAMSGVGASDLPGTGISAGAGSASGAGAADSSASGSSAGGAGGSGVGITIPPYRVTTGNITTGGSVGSVSITPDPATPSQDKLNVNFPNSGSGGGSVGLGVNALDFSGGDLGAKINNALATGYFEIDVPNTSGLVISTPIRIKHSTTLRFSSRWPQVIDCKTGNKPVLEATDPDVRNFRVIGGQFEGNASQTPSCFLLLASNSSGTQQGDCTPLSDMGILGHWGVGVLVHIGAEVCVYDQVIMSQGGTGDSPWAGHRSTVTMGNADYWNVPFAYTKPNVNARSTSAAVFQNCTVGGDIQGVGSCFLLKGQVEDTTITGTYLNAVGRCCILIEPGDPPNTGVTVPRRLHVTGGGRVENNKGVAWAGVPFMIVDGMGVGGALNYSSIGQMGFFFGGAGGSMPLVQCINGGSIFGFSLGQGVYVEGTDTLIDHRGADLHWADIKFPIGGMKIDCTGRSIINSDIKIAGNALGTIGAGTKVRAANVFNW